jgi:hypothetical protein
LSSFLAISSSTLIYLTSCVDLRFRGQLSTYARRPATSISESSKRSPLCGGFSSTLPSHFIRFFRPLSPSYKVSPPFLSVHSLCTLSDPVFGRRSDVTLEYFVSPSDLSSHSSQHTIFVGRICLVQRCCNILCSRSLSSRVPEVSMPLTAFTSILFDSWEELHEF